MEFTDVLLSMFTSANYSAIVTSSSSCSFLFLAARLVLLMHACPFSSLCHAMRAAMSASALMRADDDVETLDLVPAELHLLDPLLPVFDTLSLGLISSCDRCFNILPRVF